MAGIYPIHISLQFNGFLFGKRERERERERETNWESANCYFLAASMPKVNSIKFIGVKWWLVHFDTNFMCITHGNPNMIMVRLLRIMDLQPGRLLLQSTSKPMPIWDPESHKQALQL